MSDLPLPEPRTEEEAAELRRMLDEQLDALNNTVLGRYRLYRRNSISSTTAPASE